MMKLTLALAAVTVLAAAPLHAQGFELSFDAGLGVDLGPKYPGADEGQTQPWVILRDEDARQGDGFSISPSFGVKGSRDDGDGDLLEGLDEIDPAFELGLRLGYGFGPLTTFATVRRGFGGHEGITGAVGAKYRTELSPELTLWSGLRAGYGDDSFNDTYFGVTGAESAASGLPETGIGGGFNEAALTFEARYEIGPETALLGEVRYAKLIGDAADSPVVQDDYQPSLRLGVVRRFSFGF